MTAAKPAPYAATTTVSVKQTRAELIDLLEKHGCTAIGYSTAPGAAVINFAAFDRWVRFRLTFAGLDSFRTSPAGQRRTQAQAEKAQDQHIRSRWRALLLVVRAKLESVEQGVEEFDEAFLAHIVVPGGATVYQATSDAIANAYTIGRVEQPTLGITS